MKPRVIILVLAIALAAVCAVAQTDKPVLKLPAIISDNMVLQQGIQNPIWGWAPPGTKVAVSIGAQKLWASADPTTGKWTVKLQPIKALATPLTMTITNGDTSLTVKNILVGEVWVCSGQSNMDFGLGGVVNSQQEIANAKYPEMRQFAVGYAAPEKPAEDCQGQWVVCTPETAGGFTAVGYFFGLNIHQALKVPVGLIKSAVGGTPVESWTSLQMMRAEPEFAQAIDLFNKTITGYPAAMKKYEEDQAAWDAAMRKPVEDAGWEAPGFDDSTWKEMAVPKNFEANGLYLDGVVWFRREINVPKTWEGKDLLLSLGPIDDEDITYWNGQKVGEGKLWNEARKYTVPGKLVKAGKTVIAVRVNDTAWNGGIYGKPEELLVSPATAPDASIPLLLSGQWKYSVAFVIPPRPEPPMGPGNAFLPTALYNGMINPFVPFGIRGAIWYQGEGNERDKPDSYFYKMRGMITGWRKVWGLGDFPFYFTQIANFRDSPKEPAGDDGVHWATVRMSQFKTLAVPNTGMAVTIDLADPGNPGDIHPKDKQDVGKRIALWALAKTYGKTGIVYSGPLYKTMKVEGNKIRLTFDFAQAGLIVADKQGIAPVEEIKGGKLANFAIAGADKKWYWADAKIDGQTVVVSSPSVPNPVAVRYAYYMNPAGNKLYNKSGLPASPFRTDNW